MSSEISISFNNADARTGLIDPALALAGWGSSYHFNVIVLIYTQMYKFFFRSVNTLFILGGNKTRQRPCAQAYPWRVTCFIGAAK